ncbi:hypothetical protein MPTK1_6g10060 [Marchantia polymorpha subsp. ruderalis]|uniref:Uncharacterized protein n=2 Tax=Marchantia polymorpha TaxID=3197 RepID=A0AAF6BQG3_MARPO|nr:hypothetical protein MARPO_0016s0049 [Marchantia polymorpha]BBN14247.1 hypothetical protein Mp_6g10060 [Marchantia polymorpha subsp. ruderalis]|eukprot:PTQ44982.1 hypothetical protein MARPO_0016s0049 [Marchantia polymorpha]
MLRGIDQGTWCVVLRLLGRNTTQLMSLHKVSRTCWLGIETLAQSARLELFIDHHIRNADFQLMRRVNLEAMALIFVICNRFLPILPKLRRRVFESYLFFQSE